MRKDRQKSGFTLLEIIVVILIVAVLAGLALPRFFRTVEYSRGMEALTNLGSIRQAMQRCYLFDNSYVNCTLSDLDIEDPGTAPNALFSYAVSGQTASAFLITANRNTAQNGDGTSTITIDQDGNRGGTGVYSSIR